MQFSLCGKMGISTCVSGMIFGKTVENSEHLKSFWFDILT